MESRLTFMAGRCFHAVRRQLSIFLHYWALFFYAPLRFSVTLLLRSAPASMGPLRGAFYYTANKKEMLSFH